MNSTLPGYHLISSASSTFGFKARPVTNEEWNYTSTLPWHHTPLGVPTGNETHLALLHHDWRTGITTLDSYGATLDSCIGRIQSALVPQRNGHHDGPYVFRHTGFTQRPQPAQIEQELSSIKRSDLVDFGLVLVFGSCVLLDMTCPSNRYKYKGPQITAEDSYVIGASYFHAVAWCLIKNQYAQNAIDERERKARFDLPTDAQYEQAMLSPHVALREKTNGSMTIWTKADSKLCEKDYGLPKHPYGQRKGSIIVMSQTYNYTSQRDFDHPWTADAGVTFSPVMT